MAKSSNKPQKIPIYEIRDVQHEVNTMAGNNRGILTDLHAHLFRACLDAKRLDPASYFLDLDAQKCFSNASELEKVSCENALLYFYYGGLIKLGLKDFDGAAQMFESCVCMPALAPSCIMAASFKKLILLNLILGRPDQLPAYCSSAARSLIRSECKKYQEFANSYVRLTSDTRNSMTFSRFKRQMNKMEDELNKDRNLGLANELYFTAVQTNIAKLSNIFSKVQISKIAKYCKIDVQDVCILSELEKFLQENDVDGKIDSREGTVSFQPVKRNEQLDEFQLDNTMRRCANLDYMLSTAQEVVDEHPALAPQSTGGPSTS